MRASIKSIHLENFKGVKSAEYIFDGKNTKITGQNGAGKTTLFTAWMWLFSDRDADLHSNPVVLPIGAHEVSPRVEVVLDVDGREVTAAKIQKCTIKKSKTGGADTVSLSNSYEVNAVEYGERDFKKKMQEYGFDFDLFLPLSHPDVFTSQKSSDMRKVLFGMASEKTDKEIANMTEGASDVAEMLSNYTAEEVKAMQNATLRKIREEYGKDGEILRAKIEGMEQSKTDIDVAELELHRNTLNEQIAENNAKQEDISKEFEEQQRASDGILELKFELNDLQRKANEENNRKRREIEENISERKWLAEQEEKDIKNTEREILNLKGDIQRKELLIDDMRNRYVAAQALEFDENSLICSMCGQEYPEERKEQIRDGFEHNKAEEIRSVTKLGNDTKKLLDSIKTSLKNKEDEVAGQEKNLKTINGIIADLEKQLSELPESIDISDHPEVQEIQRKIAEKEQVMNKGNSAEEIKQQLKVEGEELQKQMDEVNGQIALAQKNVEIDEQIAGLRKKQGQYEQNKANAEKILYQLDLVGKRKNELLTDQINSHFKLVKFRLFDYLKNGSVVDDCEPMIDGKSLKDHSNGALRVLAKLDIADGLQRFYEQYYPVFVDDFSLVTDNTECRIDMGCQLIKLVAEKGVKELKIEMES